jgi:hypothetical protein
VTADLNRQLASAPGEQPSDDVVVLRSRVAELEAQVAAAQVLIAGVRTVFEMQCPPRRDHFDATDFGGGAYAAHQWWNTVLGGELKTRL